MVGRIIDKHSGAHNKRPALPYCDDSAEGKHPSQLTASCSTAFQPSSACLCLWCCPSASTTLHTPLVPPLFTRRELWRGHRGALPRPAAGAGL